METAQQLIFYNTGDCPSALMMKERICTSQYITRERSTTLPSSMADGVISLEHILII